MKRPVEVADICQCIFLITLAEMRDGSDEELSKLRQRLEAVLSKRRRGRPPKFPKLYSHLFALGEMNARQTGRSASNEIRKLARKFRLDPHATAQAYNRWLKKNARKTD